MQKYSQQSQKLPKMQHFYESFQRILIDEPFTSASVCLFLPWGGYWCKAANIRHIQPLTYSWIGLIYLQSASASTIEQLIGAI